MDIYGPNVEYIIRPIVMKNIETNEKDVISAIGLDDLGSDGGDAKSDVSSNVSEPVEVVEALLGGAHAEEKHDSPHESEAELLDMVGGGDEGDAVPVPLAPVAVDPAALAVPLPDPVGLVAPIWDVGIQRAEKATTGKSKCMVCSLAIDRGSIRIVHQQSKAATKFLHPGCCAGVPDAHKAHSRATLVHQRAFGGGHLVLDINAAIDVALPLLV